VALPTHIKSKGTAPESGTPEEKDTHHLVQPRIALPIQLDPRVRRLVPQQPRERLGQVHLSPPSSALSRPSSSPPSATAAPAILALMRPARPHTCVVLVLKALGEVVGWILGRCRYRRIVGGGHCGFYVGAARSGADAPCEWD